MNGNQIKSSANIVKVSNLYQEVIDRGDINADGKVDALWCNNRTGTNVMWLMDGVKLSNSYQLNTVPVSWLLVQLGDLNGDGTSDLIWRNQINGRDVTYLIFEAGQILSSPDINVVDNQSWQMADILDLNGDGKTDVFWRNTQGNTVIY